MQTSVSGLRLVLVLIAFLIALLVLASGAIARNHPIPLAPGLYPGASNAT